ncbi:MAG: hypothetical protein RDV48_14160 [Candidatus Eremiobacteraeota bacterium]|nr:hypothetical protein [Candidatus Eremiobacteraeota bacterium]
MLKKALLALALFIAVFIITAVIRFPYISMLSSMAGKLSTEKKIDVSWERSTGSFPSIKLSSVRIVSEENEVAVFDSIDMFLSLSGMTFRGSQGAGRVSGKIARQKLDYTISSLPIPAFLSTSLGKGTLNASGTYDIKTGKGKGKFDASIEQFPNPLISGALTIDGQDTIEPRKTGIVFNLKGASLTGKGTVTITSADASTPSQVQGVLEVKVGQMPLIFNIQGTLNNIAVTKA